jgi:hypothetical protein
MGRYLRVQLARLARLAGFEPATRCLEGMAPASPYDAACGLTSSFSPSRSWTWPDVAQCLRPVAPQLAPQNLVRVTSRVVV